MTSLGELEELLVARPLRSSRQIQREFGLSQPTVSRLLRRADDAVLKIGRGRATRYAWSVAVFDVARAVPLSVVQQDGWIRRVGELRLLSDGRYLVEADDLPPWLAGSAGNGLFPSLPYFLEDLRPSGFLGRAIAQEVAGYWDVSTDPRQWTHVDLGRFLTRRGQDLHGNLLVGRRAAEQVAARAAEDESVERGDYPGIARRAIDGEVVGSSAAGEQPKFAVRVAGRGAVIVKFTASGDSLEATRWRDLLRAEWHAAQVIRENGHEAVTADVIELEGRVFLEIQRFDRVPGGGRAGAISMAMVDAEFVGHGQGWARVATELHALGLLSTQDRDSVLWLEFFGRWIGNSDMHLGNLSLRPTGSGFQVLPAYDMLPMTFAPMRGEFGRSQITPPPRTREHADIWESARAVAERFWERVLDDPRISPAFKAAASEAFCRATDAE